MVEVGSASSRVEGSSFVSLEDGGVGFDGDGGWSLGDGGLELGNGVGLNLDVGLNVDLTLGLVVLAGTLSGSVWVGTLELLTVGLDVVEGVGLPSSLASVRGGVAVDDLLLGEAQKVSGGNLMVSLNGGGGGESPA